MASRRSDAPRLATSLFQFFRGILRQKRHFLIVPCRHFQQVTCREWSFFAVFDSLFLRAYCFSYSPLLTRFRTVKPAFFASEIESALGELNVDQILRTGFLHAGQFVNGLAVSGRCK